MKKLSVLFVSAVAIGLFFNSCDAKKAAPELSSKVDSVSYFIGVDIGENMKNLPGEKLNLDMLIKGLQQAMASDSSVVTMDRNELQMFMQTYFMEAEQKDNDKRKADSQKFLEDNKKKDGVQVTPSGLQYKVITEGSGEKPDSASVVKVNYKGTLVDGTVFDSSYDRGEPATFPLNQVIKGWTEGIRMMSVGSKYMFFVPSELGYGDRGMGGKIKGNMALIFEVELLGIEAPQAPAAPEMSEPILNLKK